MGLRARPTLVLQDDDNTVEISKSDVTGMLRIPTNRRAERSRILVVSVVAGCDDLKYAQLPVGRPLVIGRDATCDLVIDHASVSRRHATVEVHPDSEGLVVTDLGSTNGTWLGTKQVVGAAAVDPGDRIGIGYVTVRVESLAEEELSQLERVGKKLRSSGVDALTGLLTRSWLQEEMPQVVEEHARTHLPLAAVFVDIDHFKSINDTFGHATGDAVLRVVAKSVAESIRASDVAVRYGGEEFLIVLKRTTPTTGHMIAERVRRAMLDIPWGEHGVVGRPVTLSCGVSNLRTGEDASSWLKRADEALYKAKAAGRNQTIHGD